MNARRVLMLPVAAALLAGVASPLRGAGQTRLDLVGDARGSALAFQEWAQVLGKAGIKNVRIRSGEDTDKVGIDVQGSEKSPLYVVTGLVASRDELILPGGRYKRSDAGRLARWLDDLAANGPPDRRPPRTAFGLTKEQFDEVHEDLARPVGFSTKGMARSQAVAKLGSQLRLPLGVDPQWKEAAADDKVEEDLSTLSCGTALACLLRPAGFCLVPREVGKRPTFGVVKAKPDQEVWPVGWEPPKDKQARGVLPELFEFHNVNVENVAAATALGAIGERLKVPVLMDHNALARHGVDPAKATVSLPQSHTNYSLALRKLLFQAGLKFEVRVDEVGTPFLWVSTAKPV
jgi:hypothetical protein